MKPVCNILQDIHYLAADRGESALSQVAKHKADQIDSGSLGTGTYWSFKKTFDQRVETMCLAFFIKSWDYNNRLGNQLFSYCRRDELNTCISGADPGILQGRGGGGFRVLEKAGP